jgi:YD repeat-containing protein
MIGTALSSQSTAKERDAETGLDNFIARYYSSPQGRFTSPRSLVAGGFTPFSGVTPQVTNCSSTPPFGNNQYTGAGYDAAGNVILGAVTVASPDNGTYDAENRLTNVTGSPDFGVRYYYDGSGRRSMKEAPTEGDRQNRHLHFHDEYTTHLRPLRHIVAAPPADSKLHRRHLRGRGGQPESSTSFFGRRGRSAPHPMS